MLSPCDEDENSVRRSALSNRDVLEMAAENVDITELTDIEKNALDIFQQKLSKLRDLEEERAELGRQFIILSGRLKACLLSD